MALLREVFFIIGEHDAVLWSDASCSPVSLPDSRARWEAIWSRRDRLVEIAHSHPIGPLAFSNEDESTMAALAAALGRSITFSVVAPHGMVRRDVAPDSKCAPNHERVHEPRWTDLMRLASGMAPRSPQED